MKKLLEKIRFLFRFRKHRRIEPTIDDFERAVQIQRWLEKCSNVKNF